MKNKELANIFYEIADLLELEDVQWKPAAYRKAARGIENLTEDISDVYEREGTEGLKSIHGIGSNICNHIVEYLKTGKIEKFEKLKKQSMSGASELIEIEGLGPKTIRKLHDELNIKSISDLRDAIQKHKIQELEGMGEKTEHNLLEAIKNFEKSHERMLIDVAMETAEDVISYLKEQSKPDIINYAGSLRRMKETIGDIDVLAVTDNSEELMESFVSMENIERIVSKGRTRSTVVLSNGVSVDIRVIETGSYGSAMQYFTGSKQHNIELRNIALDKGYKLSEYGLFDKKSGKKIEGRSEERIYGALGLAFIPPPLRENRGEFKAATNDSIPDLIEVHDLMGDLHIHTDFSEGIDKIESMVSRAEEIGYDYIAITDHSRSRKVANGLSIDELSDQWKQIDDLSGKYNIKILKGSEVDILPDGNLDYPDKILDKLDVVVGAIHSGFKYPESKMTRRIISAMENEYLNILAHPSGRLIGKREGYKADFDSVFEAAARNNKVLEINSQPKRLDLNDSMIIRAKKAGVKFCINSDSHGSSQMEYVHYGIGQAKRGWLTADDVVNTYSYNQLMKTLNKS